MGEADSILARIVHAARAELVNASPDLQQESMRQLFDTLVCMASGSRQLPPVSTTDRGAATLVGHEVTTEPLTAAARNAMAAHADDLDDVHWGSVTHPGSVVWPVLLAVAQEDESAASVLARAGALAYQVTARTAQVLGGRHRAAVHATAFAGAIGATAGAVALLGDDDDAMVTAMAHAASVAGGTTQALTERSRTAVVHRGAAASAAMLAVGARTLRPAVRAPLAGSGTLLGVLGEAPDTTELDHLHEPAVAVTATRFHPVTGFAHTLVDCVRDLGRVAPDEVVAIEAVVPDHVVALTRHDPPTSAWEAHWHLEHAVAAQVCDMLDGPGLEWPAGAALLRVRDRVVVRGRPSVPADMAVSVEMRCRSGRTLSAQREVPRGHPADPCNDGDRIAKAVRLGALDPDRAAALLGDLVSCDIPVTHGLLRAFARSQ